MEVRNLTIERAYTTDALSAFSCGVREIDLLIHKKENGLRSFVELNPCEFYIVYDDERIPVATFVISRRTITMDEAPEDSIEIDFLAVKKEYRKQRIGTILLQEAEERARNSDYNFLTVGAFKNKRYSAVGFYEKCGFILNGKQEGNAVPMIKYLEPNRGMR